MANQIGIVTSSEKYSFMAISAFIYLFCIFFLALSSSLGIHFFTIIFYAIIIFSFYHVLNSFHLVISCDSNQIMLLNPFWKVTTIKIQEINSYSINPRPFIFFHRYTTYLALKNKKVLSCIIFSAPNRGFQKYLCEHGVKKTLFNSRL